MTDVITAASAVTPQDAQAQYQAFLIAIDADSMRPRLLDHVGGAVTDDCAVLDAKLEPGRPAVVLYRVGDRLVHGTVPPSDPTGLGPAAVNLSTYPSDPGLPGLPSVADPHALAETLESGLREGGELEGGESLQGASVESVRCHLLRYRPGRRATFLVEADLRRQAQTTPVRLVAKVYHDEAKAAPVVDEGRALADPGPRPPLVLAPVVGYAARQSVVFQQHLPGRVLVIDPAGDLLRQTEELQRAAAGLAAFHALAVSNGRVRPLERELSRFVSRADGARSVEPSTGAHLLGLAQRLLSLPRPAPVASLVHGDCKPGQFLLQDSAVALLDLDHCGVADPAYDIGNMVASLRQHAVLQDPAHLGSAVRLGDEFVEAYLHAGPAIGTTDLPDRIDYYAAVALMRKALRAFARAPRSPAPLRIVDEAHRGLDHRPQATRGDH